MSNIHTLLNLLVQRGVILHRTILNWLALPASGFISSWGVSTLSGWMMTVKTMRAKRVGTFLESESPRNGKMGCATGPKISAHHVRKHSLKIWMLARNRFCLQAEWHSLYLFPFWERFFTRFFVDKLAPPLAIILDYVGKRKHQIKILQQERCFIRHGFVGKLTI